MVVCMKKTLVCGCVLDLGSGKPNSLSRGEVLKDMVVDLGERERCQPGRVSG